MAIPIHVTRDASGPLRFVVHVRSHTVTVDVGVDAGGEDAGPDPHDLYDAALAACKALTTLMYARRRAMPVGDVGVVVSRDSAAERGGVYRLTTTLAFDGSLTDVQRHDLLRVATKCPIHRLMTEVETQIETVLAPVQGAGA